MWLLSLVFFPLLLYLLPVCFTFKTKKRRKKSFGVDSKTFSISEDLTTTKSQTLTVTPTPRSTTGKKSDLQRSDEDEKELFLRLKMDKKQIAQVKELPKKEQDNWKKWARLNLTKELDRADGYYLEHDCKGLLKNNCKGCKDYLKLIKSLRTYQHRYGSFSPAPSNEKEVAMALKEFEQRAFWFGMIWDKQKFVKINEGQNAKAKQIVNNDRKRRQKLTKTIKDWRKAKKKREEEKQKLEKKRLAQLKKETEIKKKKNQQKQAEPPQIDESRYENIFDTEGGQQFMAGEKKSSQPVVVTNCQYENLFDAETKPGGKMEQKKPIDESKYENLMDAQTLMWEAEKKPVVEKKKEEKPPPVAKMEEGYESLFDAIGGEPATEKVLEDKMPEVKKPEKEEKKPREEAKKSENEKKPEVKKPETKTSPVKLYTAESPDDSSSSDDSE